MSNSHNPDTFDSSPRGMMRLLAKNAEDTCYMLQSNQLYLRDFDGNLAQLLGRAKQAMYEVWRYCDETAETTQPTGAPTDE